MPDIATRHIRHDWSGWVDWQAQKSVKTLCNVKSKPHLCGIPGVTEQAFLVTRAGTPTWGWCMNCVRHLWPYLMPPALGPGIAPQAIIDLHQNAQSILAPQRLDNLRRRLKFAYQDGNMPNTIWGLTEEIDKHIAEFGDPNLGI